MFSYAFRKLYSNVIDDELIQYVREEFNLNLIEFRSLLSQVETKIKQVRTNKEKIEKRIIELMDDIVYLKQKEKLTKKETRKLFKLNKKLSYLNRILPRNITFGGYDLLRRISFLNNDKVKNHNEIVKLTKEYHKKRIMPFYLLGEANQKGNRFFDFNLNENKVIYKPSKGIKIEIDFHKQRNKIAILKQLQEMVDKKEISITVSVSDDHICFTFDDQQLYGFAIDVAARRKQCKGKKKDEIKEIYKEHYDMQRDKMLSDKLQYRYLAVDTNPNDIGVSILDDVNGEMRIVKTFYFTGLGSSEMSNNKRKHQISHVWKKIFSIFRYYKCGYLVMEDLNFDNKSLDNKVANRKVKNLWHRELSSQIIEKNSNRYGIINIFVNPVHTSFIGNLLYPYVDAVNASVAIGYRGINKYIKDKFNPPMDIDTIMNTVRSLNPGADVSFMKGMTWVELHRKMKESGLRFRAKREDSKISSNEVFNQYNVGIDCLFA